MKLLKFLLATLGLNIETMRSGWGQDYPDLRKDDGEDAYTALAAQGAGRRGD